MVYEDGTKKQLLKRISQQGNFKNIALSVARRHQKLMCTFLNSDDFFGKMKVKSDGMLYSCMCILYIAGWQNILLYCTCIPFHVYIGEGFIQTLLSHEPEWIQESFMSYFPMADIRTISLTRYLHYICI